MRFLNCFFHQTTPPGPIRGYLEPFLILATFHGVIQVLKRLLASRTLGSCGFPVSRTPGSRESPLSWTPGSWASQVSRTPGICFFLYILFFKLQANLLSSRTPGIHESPVSRMPGVENLLWPGCRGVTFDCLLFFFKFQAIATAFKAMINNLSKTSVHL